jgi:hypothetical protein
MTKPDIVVLDQANNTGAMDQGQEVGPAASPGTAEPPAAPPRPAAPAKLAQKSPQVSVTQGYTTANDPDRGTKSVQSRGRD